MRDVFVCYLIKLWGLFMSKVYWNAWSKTLHAVDILTQIVLLLRECTTSSHGLFSNLVVVFIEGEFLKHCFSYYRRPGIFPNRVVVSPIPLASIGALVHLRLFYLVSEKRRIFKIINYRSLILENWNKFKSFIYISLLSYNLISKAICSECADFCFQLSFSEKGKTTLT